MAPRPEIPETELLARIRAGDRAAFERLFRTWYPRLADWAFRLLESRDAAEDAVQEVFVAIWQGRERLPEAQSIAAYLHRAVRNRALNQLRHQKTAGKWIAAQESEPAISPDAETGLADRELDAAYRAALAELAPRGREVFVLSRERGLTYAQIAETLGISVKTVETLMGRAIGALRRKLGPALGG
jgi:RNA polymerase sigma-70 factor (ECF subfamily)